ncbi:ectoine hydrolase [Bradyrhizobium sp. Rc2d]|uniref:M24 family metallopeptidase n=1 Tax=Bradyrhizobium sp. Rc2d TaxID=1855321 RepID=UPI0008840C06|nr:Xaa-Pro peptidase family protein [Bradyrhizobium sp. Rc2d]SDJ98730.1 ectoine hydrolase [Bradyrhizobium sp. Rc2d]
MNVSEIGKAFPRSEYIRRLAAVKSEMERREVDAIIINNPTDLAYLTGHTQGHTFSAQGLVVSLKEEEPTFILRQMDAMAAIHKVFLRRENIVGYSEAFIANPNADGYDVVIDCIEKIGLSSGRLGLGLSTLPVEKFRSRLPNAKMVDVANLVSWVRIVKSELEISVMREAAAITDAAIAKAAEVIRAGVREADAAAEIIATLIRGANGKPGTDIQNFFLCASPRTGTGHISWTDDILRDGSQVNLELGGKRHGYCVAIMRTFSIGTPSDRLLRIHEAEVAGLEAALSKVRPGATCSDVAKAFYRTIEKRGFRKESRCGYSIGINWFEPTAMLKEDDLTELRPNMTFHLMLGNWIEEDFGYVIGETFRVTETGFEVFTKTPRKLFEI